MKRLLTSLTIAAAVLLSGCATTPPAEQTVDLSSWSTNSLDAACVAVGLTKLNPSYWDGWDGDCPGADLDVDYWEVYCKNKGVPVIKLFNAEATQTNVVAAGVAAAKALRPGGVLILYYSGHGIQQPDRDGDEEDHKDEALCLYDGPFLDDTIHSLFQRARGIRIWMITDCCTSGTIARGAVQRKVVSQIRLAARTSALEVPVILYAGCDDGKVSYGNATLGGQFTFTLYTTDATEEGLTYGGTNSYFSKAAPYVPEGQVPVYAEFGPVTDEFRNTEVTK